MKLTIHIGTRKERRIKMTFKEYRAEQSHFARFNLSIVEGKNLKKEHFVQDDFEEDTEYVLDDYQVKVDKVNWGHDLHFLTLTK